MLNKVSAVARLAGIALAVVAGFMPDLGFNVGLILVVLGLVSGVTMAAERYVPVAATVLVIPAVAAGLAMIPAVGAQLGAVLGGIALLAAGALASSIAMTLFDRVKEDIGGLGK
ncbi:MAG: hypothetical protein K2W91_13390 [Novosphingobium sp.]|nr:hypothetical protein [Novosphingobium sp.]